MKFALNKQVEKNFTFTNQCFDCYSSDISDADDTSGLSLVIIAPTEAAAAEAEPTVEAEAVVLTWGEAEGQEEDENDEDECSCCSDNLSWLKDLTLHDWSGEQSLFFLFVYNFFNISVCMCVCGC